MLKEDSMDGTVKPLASLQDGLCSPYREVGLLDLPPGSQSNLGEMTKWCLDWDQVPSMTINIGLLNWITLD